MTTGGHPQNDGESADSAKSVQSAEGVWTQGDRYWEDASAFLEMPVDGESPYELVWPECEFLIETALSVNDQSNTDPFPPPLSYVNDKKELAPPFFHEPYPQPIASAESSSYHMDGMQTVHSNIFLATMTAVKYGAFPPAFLDRCLNIFFERFVSTLPVLHRATFVFQEYTPPILLSAMAIGSLYMEKQGSRARGEMLWDLAHALIKANWHSLLVHQGPYDLTNGVQLGITVLLCRIYGMLSSKQSIRESSRGLSDASLAWAENCGILDSGLAPNSAIPAADASDDEKHQLWRYWLAREIKTRVLSGYYVLDGLDAQMLGRPAPVYSMMDMLSAPCSDDLFDNDTASDWLVRMHGTQEKESHPLKDVFSVVFSASPGLSYPPSTLSSLSLHTVLSRLQSSVLDCAQEEVTTFGIWAQSDTKRALIQVHDNVTQMQRLQEPQCLELLLRWHTVCLELTIGSSVLWGAICHQYNIEQSIVEGADIEPSELLDWPTTRDGRTALLHAVAILDTVQQIRADQPYTIHLPSSLFSASAVFGAFALGGLRAIDVPPTVDWQDVLFVDVDPSIILGELSKPTNSTGAREFIHGGNLTSPGTTHYILQDLESMRKYLHSVGRQWGIALEMEGVVQNWISLSR
ncbi:MAG: hypothetical protein LQ340_005055 [Diploschistes diacapsis]|nr:MAG: hypothetical protein LQ340_005055 [Diploschistes diacapsis]